MLVILLAGCSIVITFQLLSLEENYCAVLSSICLCGKGCTSRLFVRRCFCIVLADGSSKDCWSRIQENLELVSRTLKGILLSLTALYQASSSYPLFVVMCLALKDTYHDLSFHNPI